jgi:hypothetical protein
VCPALSVQVFRLVGVIEDISESVFETEKGIIRIKIHDSEKIEVQ